MGYYHNGRIRREEVRLQRPEEYLWKSGDRLVTDYEVRAFAAVFGVAFENLIEDEE